MREVILDTNILMDGVELSEFSKIYLPITVPEELDKIKHTSEGERNYKARKAIQQIEKANNIEYKLDYSYSFPIWLDRNVPDNRILGFAKDIVTTNPNAVLISNDINVRVKAKALGIPCEKFDGNNTKLEIYTGIRETEVDNQEYKEILDDLYRNLFNLYPNEYIIIHNTTKNTNFLYMWDGEHLEEAKAKAITNSYIKRKKLSGKNEDDSLKIMPLDIYQRAFIHMLQNENARIKITDSIYGAGKSYLMLHWAIQMLEKKKFKKLYFVKSDSPPKNRKEYPPVPGGINDKSLGLLGVISDTLKDDTVVKTLLDRNLLEIIPIQLAKGRSLQSGIYYINEAQNFVPSEMEILLSRVGEGTVALVDGSTLQTDNKFCINGRNGLLVTGNNFKDKNIAAQVNMITDYRSELSRMVSQMDWHD